MTSSSAATRGAMFLPFDVAGNEQRIVIAHQLDDQRRDILGERMRIGGVVGDMDLADAGDLGGFGGDAVDALTRDEQMDFAQLAMRR